MSPLKHALSLEVPESRFITFRQQRLNTKKRLLLGFLGRESKVYPKNSPKGRHVVRMQKLLSEEKEFRDGANLDEKTLFKVCAAGDSFYLTAVGGDFMTDHVVSFVHFTELAILDKPAMWLNFVLTKSGKPTNNLFGTRVPFMDPNITWRGMGMCLLLLRLVQLHQCVKGRTPDLYIRVDGESR
jgi:hypothetical protein